MNVELVRYDAACKAISEAKAVDEVKQIRDLSIAMKAYARQAKNKELEADAWEIRTRAERRVGELIAAGQISGELQAKPGRPRNGSDSDPLLVPARLSEVGIDKHLADRARKLTKADADEFERKLQEGRTRILDVTERVRVDVLASSAHVGQNSGDNEWYTPAHFVESARKLMGGIDLDPASSVEANTVIKAKRFYTASDDGLSRKWEGRVWMNPPYAQPLISQFCDKLAESFESKSVAAAVVLVNNATETQWFSTLSERSCAVCFPCGRVRFWSPGKATAAPLQGQAILYMGTKTASFHALFSDLGMVWVKP